MTGSGRILLAHGNGGRLTGELVRGLFLPALHNPALAGLTDAAVLEGGWEGRPALTTDAFIIDPPVFPGGDIGYLSVCGTVNDLAVAGALPRWLTWALIIEEGAERELLERITAGAARAAAEASVQIVAGDTKVVPRGKGDGVFAITSGLGIVPPGRELSDARVAAGDVVLASGPLGDHGAAVLARRHGLDEGDLVSDCAPLSGLVETLLSAGVEVHAMHDPTRGGVATVCHEVASRAGARIVLEQASLPIRPQVRGIMEILGIDPLYLACEGRCLAWVPEREAGRALDLWRRHPQGIEAARIGRVERPPERGGVPLVLETEFGTPRPLDLLSGADLPRIC
jgi:hydrogenase expression/formation protein HypE